MKAVEHAIQAGTRSTNGCRSAAIAAGISTGIRIVAVAVLLAISVRNVTVKQRHIRNGIIGKVFAQFPR